MSNILAKQRLMKLRLFGIVAIIVFMFIPSTFGCVDFSVILYMGASISDATSLSDQEVSICKGDTAYFCAEFTGSNPDNHNLGWQIDYGNGDGWETKEITTYDAGGDYKIYPSPTTAKNEDYNTTGEKTPKVRVFYVDSSGDPINTKGEVVDISDDSVMSGDDVSAKDEDSKVYVVGVEKIQYRLDNGTYQDAPTSTALVFAKGTSNVDFKAIKTPSSAPDWPSGKPDWSFASGDTVDGDEEANNVTFDTASTSPTNYRTVDVECGNTVSVDVEVVDLEALEIYSKRTSNPVEADAYIVKTDEHFEIGGTFEFELMLNDGTNTWDEPEELKSEIRADSLIGYQTVGTGTGTTVSYTFKSGLGVHDPGTCKTRFYCDEDDNGKSTGLLDSDPRVDSDTYEVIELETHSLTFAKSSVVTGTPDASGACDEATKCILIKDDEDDYRAAAEFALSGSISTIAATDSESPPETHDPVDMELIGPPGSFSLDDEWEHMKYFQDNTSAEVILVNDIRPCDSSGVPLSSPDVLGFATLGTKYDMFLQEPDFDGLVLAHEAGHNCGLDDISSSTYADYVMYYEYGGNMNLLRLDDCSNYE